MMSKCQNNLQLTCFTENTRGSITAVSLGINLVTGSLAPFCIGFDGIMIIFLPSIIFGRDTLEFTWKFELNGYRIVRQIIEKISNNNLLHCKRHFPSNLSIFECSVT